MGKRYNEKNKMKLIPTTHTFGEHFMFRSQFNIEFVKFYFNDGYGNNLGLWRDNIKIQII